MDPMDQQEGLDHMVHMVSYNFYFKPFMPKMFSRNFLRDQHQYWNNSL